MFTVGPLSCNPYSHRRPSPNPWTAVGNTGHLCETLLMTGYMCFINPLCMREDVLLCVTCPTDAEKTKRIEELEFTV